MAFGEIVSGLLNLSVFSTALGLSYLGLDRFDPASALVRGNQSANNELLRLKQKMDQILKQYDLRSRNKYVFGKIPMMILEAASGIRPEFDNAFDAVLFRLVQLTFVPSAIFLSGIDVIASVFLTFACLILFLCISASTVWDLPTINNSGFAEMTYGYFVFASIWFICLLLAKYRLLSPPSTVEQMKLTIERRVKTLLKTHINRTEASTK